MSFIRLAAKLKTAKINEAVIINIILKSSKEIIKNNITLTKISNEAYISHSSITRYLQKIGYKNWAHFVRSCIIEDMMVHNKSSTSILEDMNMQRSLLSSWAKDNVKIIKDVADEIQSSNLVIFFGERSSGNIAQNLSFLFSRKRIKTTHIWFEGELEPLLDRGHFLILLTSTARTDISQLISHAQDVGTKVCILDTSDTQVKHQGADFVLKIPLMMYSNNKHSRYYIKTELLKETGVMIFEDVPDPYES